MVQLAPHTTISAAIASIPAVTTATDTRQVWVILVSHPRILR